MQPLDISTSSSSTRSRRASPCLTSSASMLISLMSLTMTATRRPSRLRRTWLSSVVFPEPRKPESTVTGRRSRLPINLEMTLVNDVSSCQWVLNVVRWLRAGTISCGFVSVTGTASRQAVASSAARMAGLRERGRNGREPIGRAVLRGVGESAEFAPRRDRLAPRVENFDGAVVVWASIVAKRHSLLQAGLDTYEGTIYYDNLLSTRRSA